MHLVEAGINGGNVHTSLGQCAGKAIILTGMNHKYIATEWLPSIASPAFEPCSGVWFV